MDTLVTPKISMPIFYCTFSNGVINHDVIEHNEQLVDQLSHLYSVCIAVNHGNRKEIVGGFVLKTNLTHTDEEFPSALSGCCQNIDALKEIYNPNMSFLPSRLGVKCDERLTELDYLYLMQKQYLKFSESGVPC